MRHHVIPGEAEAPPCPRCKTPELCKRWWRVTDDKGEDYFLCEEHEKQ